MILFFEVNNIEEFSNTIWHILNTCTLGGVVTFLEKQEILRGQKEVQFQTKKKQKKGERKRGKEKGKETKNPTQTTPALSNREDVQEKISTELVNQQVDHQSWKPSNFPTIKTQSLMVSVGFSDLGIIRAVASSF